MVMTLTKSRAGIPDNGCMTKAVVANIQKRKIGIDFVLKYVMLKKAMQAVNIYESDWGVVVIIVEIGKNSNERAPMDRESRKAILTADNKITDPITGTNIIFII